MTTPEKDDQNSENLKSAEALTSSLDSLEDTRTDDKFEAAFSGATKELSAYKNNIENLSPQEIVAVAKMAREAASSADSAAKRSFLPEKRVALYAQALSDVLEPFYKNPVFIQKLRDAIQSGTLTGDQPNLIYEMWRDVAKFAHSAAALYRGDQYENLINFSNWVWEELLKELPADHTLAPFMRIEQQVFLQDTGFPVNADQVIKDIEAMKDSDLDANPHRLGTMAIKVRQLGRKINNKQVRNKGAEIFDLVKEKSPKDAKKLESLGKTFKALMYTSVISQFIPMNMPTATKDSLHPRLTGLKEVPFLPQPISDIQ